MARPCLGSYRTSVGSTLIITQTRFTSIIFNACTINRVSVTFLYRTLKLHKSTFSLPQLNSYLFHSYNFFGVGFYFDFLAEAIYKKPLGINRTSFPTALFYRQNISFKTSRSLSISLLLNLSIFLFNRPLSIDRI